MFVREVLVVIMAATLSAVLCPPTHCNALFSKGKGVETLVEQLSHNSLILSRDTYTVYINGHSSVKIQ